VRPADGKHPPQPVAVEFDGHEVAKLELPPAGGGTVSFRVPKALVQPKNALRFVFGSGAETGRQPARVPFRSMMFRPALDQPG
jgi:hypothetical protein